MSRGSLCLTLLLAAPVWGALGAAPARGQTPDFRHGTHALRRILHEAGVTALSQEELNNLPREEFKKVIIIILGEMLRAEDSRPIANLFRAPLADCVKQEGAALLVATDRQEQIFSLEQHRFALSPPLVTNPEKAYRKLESCLFVEPGGKDPDSPFRGVQRLATNRPACFFYSGQSGPFPLKVMARFSAENLKVEGGGTPLKFAEYPFALGGGYGAGRVMVLSDHSVFINDMMLQEDNDNVPFAFALVKWLAEGKRTHVAFYENGELQTRLDLPVKEPPPPPVPTQEEVLEVVNNGIVGLEKEDFFNQNLILNRVDPQTLSRLFVVLSLIGLFVYGFIRLGLARHRPEPGLEALASVPNPYEAGYNLLDLRQRALLQSDNVTEAARLVARNLFEEHARRLGLTSAALADGPEPQVKARALRPQVRRLWRWAYGQGALRVTKKELAEALARLPAVRAALVRGDVALRGEAAPGNPGTGSPSAS